MNISQEREPRLLADEGDLEAMRESLAVGADPDAVDAEGFVPLHDAMNSISRQPFKDRFALGKLLVEAIPDLDACSANGQPPLRCGYGRPSGDGALPAPPGDRSRHLPRRAITRS